MYRVQPYFQAQRYKLLCGPLDDEYMTQWTINREEEQVAIIFSTIIRWLRKLSIRMTLELHGSYPTIFYVRE